MKWIVESTRVPSLRYAMIIAQLIANAERITVPIVFDKGEDGLVVIRMIEPRPIG